MDLFRHAKDAATYPAGTPILRSGAEGDVMYVVQEGQVEIRIGERVLERVGPGGFFGEMALIDHSPRSASAFAATDVKLVTLDESRFLRMVQETPGFALAVMRQMAQRLRRMDARS